MKGRRRVRRGRRARGRKRSLRRSRSRQLVRWLAIGLACVVGGTAVIVLPFRFVRPPTTAFILRDPTPSSRSVPREWIPLRELGDTLPIAVVAAEDQKFPQHRGFDFEAIESALREGDRGASTLSQQVAKNLYLWPGRSWIRKGLEAWLTLFIEALWPKERILEVYLNVAEFGPGVFGAAAASRSYWGVEPHQLSLDRASHLAAVLPAPRSRSATRPSEFVSGRARAIRVEVQRLGGAAYLASLGDG